MFESDRSADEDDEDDTKRQGRRLQGMNRRETPYLESAGLVDLSWKKNRNDIGFSRGPPQIKACTCA
jgi:hypothetical protein